MEKQSDVADPYSEIEKIMKRAKAQGVSDATILATALYSAMKDIESLKKRIKQLDHRTIGSIRLGNTGSV